MITLLWIVWWWFLLGITAWIVESLLDYFLFNKQKPSPKTIFLAIGFGPIAWFFYFKALRYVYKEKRETPKNLKQCFKFLDKTLNKEDYIEAKKNPDFGIIAHHTLGRTLRNEWGLWSGSKLKNYFNEIGIYHADDMTGIIFTSYHRYLNGKDLKLYEQAHSYIDYWEKEKQND